MAIQDGTVPPRQRSKSNSTQSKTACRYDRQDSASTISAHCEDIQAMSITIGKLGIVRLTGADLTAPGALACLERDEWSPEC